ncbi:MAG: RNA polymerase sigma factor [Proteobacteria bacterium]|nr:MAG: RNA polymerase sigma factor [Pseudomonadota bacterium]
MRLSPFDEGHHPTAEAIKLELNVKQSSQQGHGIDVASVPMPAPEVSDDELVEKIKSDGFMAYGELVKRHNQRMFRVARSVFKDHAIAMDIVQESHIKAFKKLDSYQGPGTFAAWLARITRNEALMYLRKHAKEQTMGEQQQTMVDNHQLKPDYLIINKQPDDILQGQHMQSLLSQQLDHLSEKFRSVFVLRAVEQLSTKETAEILNINEITVKTRYFRAKTMLRNQIKKQLASSELQVYEFGNQHCDLVLLNVLTAIARISR